MKTNLRWIIAVTAAAAILPLCLSAATLNLGVNGSALTSGPLGGATFSLTPIYPTGTGVIDPFLRMQASNNPVEDGYNTDGVTPNSTMDDLAGIWTHSIQLGNVGRTADGSLLFLLDANQNGQQPNLSLSRFILFTSSGPAPMGLNTLQALKGAAGLNQAFSIGNNSAVNFYVQNTGDNHMAQNGSGSGDLYVAVPLSELTGIFTAESYLTLYAEFGGTPGTFQNNDGFEEWATANTDQVPDPSSTLMLLGMGLMSIECLRRKLSK